MNAITIRKHLITNILSRRTFWFGAALGWLLAAVGAVLAQPTLQFAASRYTVSEAAASVTLTVQRLNDLSTEIHVDYATTNGTTTAGLKFTAISGTLAFGAGETTKTILVPILNGGFVEGTKTFGVVLSNPTGGGVLGARERYSLDHR